MMFAKNYAILFVLGLIYSFSVVVSL